MNCIPSDRVCGGRYRTRKHGTAAGGAKNSPVDCFLVRGWWSPGTSTGMTAVKSLSFAQHKSEQNKIVSAKAGYHYGSGILPFVLYGAFGGNRCVRTYAEKWQNFTISGCSFMVECGILGLAQ